jgi:hypothetical protein
MDSTEQVHERLVARRFVAGLGGIVIVLLGAACVTPTVSSVPIPAPTVAAQPAAPASAARPAAASLKIISPQPGEGLPAGTIKVSLSYSGPTLVPGAQAMKLEDYHLHYFLDEDATPYIGTARPIPTGNPHIVHSAASEVGFDNVSPGSHTLSVVMTGSNHISVEDPLSDTVTFTVR